MDKREGLRDGPRRVLDQAAKQRRKKKALDMLEQDNHVEEPQSEVKSTSRPQFDDDDESRRFLTNRRSATSSCISSGQKQRKRKLLSTANVVSSRKSRLRQCRPDLVTSSVANSNAELTEPPPAAMMMPNNASADPSLARHLQAAMPHSRLPARKFCDVCGYRGLHCCVSCGTHYCCKRCLDIHIDTRCMKWVA